MPNELTAGRLGDVAVAVYVFGWRVEKRETFPERFIRVTFPDDTFNQIGPLRASVGIDPYSYPWYEQVDWLPPFTTDVVESMHVVLQLRALGYSYDEEETDTARWRARVARGDNLRWEGEAATPALVRCIAGISVLRPGVTIGEDFFV